MVERDSDSETAPPSVPPSKPDGTADPERLEERPEADDASGTEAAPEKSASKRRRRAKRPLLDAEGRERPPFLLGLPRDPELEELIAAFESGKYALVRERAPQLAKRTKSRKVRRAALELRRRLDPDPLLKFVFVAAAALLLYLVLWAYGHTSH